MTFNYDSKAKNFKSYVSIGESLTREERRLSDS